jgi:hypothetical protein
MILETFVTSLFTSILSIFLGLSCRLTAVLEKICQLEVNMSCSTSGRREYPTKCYFVGRSCQPVEQRECYHYHNQSVK